jgi:hypothetical protein
VVTTLSGRWSQKCGSRCHYSALIEAPVAGKAWRKALPFSRRGFSRPSFASQKDQATKRPARSDRSRFVYETPLIDSPPAKNKRIAERRQTHLSSCPHASGVRDAPRRKRLAPPSACGRARLPAFHLRFSPTGLSSRRFSVGPGFPRGGIRERTVPHAPPVRSQRCTSRAGRNAGRHDARAARVRSVSFHPRVPHSLRHQEVPSQKASFNERD